MKVSRTHSLLLAMRLPDGQYAVWGRSPMGAKCSSDNFVQQVVWTKMLLGLLAPWRASGYFMNTPDMIEGGAERPYDPRPPMG